MIKALQKGLLKSWHANVKLPWPSEHENQKPPMSVVPRHCGDDAKVKTWHLTPAMSLPQWFRGYKQLNILMHIIFKHSPHGAESLISLRCALKGYVAAEDPSFLHATVKTDQTGRMPRLILVFAGRTCLFVGFAMHWLICM